VVGVKGQVERNKDKGAASCFPLLFHGFCFKKTFIPPLTDGHPNQVQTEVCFKIASAKSQN
jgi:hypothetical protein